MNRRPFFARVAASSLAALIALAVCLATPVIASPAPAKATLTFNAPIAVRSTATFIVRGTASTAVSPGETVTITMERLGKSWTVVSKTNVTVGSRQQFSASVRAAQRGHWRITASLPANPWHLSTEEVRTFKSVGTKAIALTFDDGPWPSSTAKIISALDKNDAEATFFTLGSQVRARAALVRSELAHGNAVGVHSWNHALMTRRSSGVNSADLKRCKAALLSATGKKAVWFRPPYGATNSTLKRTASSAGLRQVLWTVDTLDWKIRTKSSVVSKAVAGARNGGVILMHDGGGPRAATVAAVPTIISKLRKKGFDFLTLDEMAALGYKIR